MTSTPVRVRQPPVRRRRAPERRALPPPTGRSRVAGSDIGTPRVEIPGRSAPQMVSRRRGWLLKIKRSKPWQDVPRPCDKRCLGLWRTRDREAEFYGWRKPAEVRPAPAVAVSMLQPPRTATYSPDDVPWGARLYRDGASRGGARRKAAPRVATTRYRPQISLMIANLTGLLAHVG